MIRGLFSHHISQLFSYRKNVVRYVESYNKFLAIGSVDVPYQNGMSYGRGINLLTLEKPGSALTTPATPVKQGLGQKQRLIAKIVKNLDELYKTLDISAQLESSISLFSGRLSYRMNYESQLNSQSTFIHIYQIITNPFEEINNFALTTPAKNMLDKAYAFQKTGKLKESNAILKDFREAYGDMYVRGFHNGGFFSAIITVTSNDKSEQERVALSLNSKFNEFQANVSVDELRKSLSKRVEVSIMIDQEGGTGPNQSIVLEGNNDQKFTSFLNRVRQFPVIVQNQPIPLACQLATYRGIYPELHFIDVSEQGDKIEEYEKLRQKYVEQKNVVMHIINHQNFYSSLPPIETLTSWRNFFEDKIGKLERQKKECVRSLICPPTDIRYELPSNYVIPQMVTEVNDQRESKLLGSVWYVRESGHFKGTWTRRNNKSRVFDAEWKDENNSNILVKAALIISINGNMVNIDRYNISSTDGSDPVSGAPNRCKYIGIVNSNGAIEGKTFSCDGGIQVGWSVISIDNYAPSDANHITTISLSP